ncbi:MAG: FimV/HubP family polar landmark protein [Pseudomonadota bacterium]
MYIKYLAVILCGLLIAEPAASQTHETGASGLKEYRLSGVLTSSTRRTALLNSDTIREGTRIGDVIIESIDDRQIQIRRGSTRQVVPVGGSFTAAPRTDRDQRMMVITRPTQGIRRSNMPQDADLEHVVARGETLSGIARRYKLDGATMDQMMLALFNDNRRAFGDNVNRLKAGATLRIPDQQDLDGLAPAIAAVAVRQHHDRWRADSAPPALQLADITLPATAKPALPSAGTYGPVDRGETLMKIARSITLSDESLTTHQVMIALFDSNPHAFGNNINVLYEGAVLSLPKEATVAAVVPAVARAEVRRQMETWLASIEQVPIKSAALDTKTIASGERFSRAMFHPSKSGRAVTTRKLPHLSGSDL